MPSDLQLQSTRRPRGLFVASPRLHYCDAGGLANLGLNYQLRGLTFSIDSTNLFNVPQGHYRALPERLERATFNGTTTRLA